MGHAQGMHGLCILKATSYKAADMPCVSSALHIMAQMRAFQYSCTLQDTLHTRK